MHLTLDLRDSAARDQRFPFQEEANESCQHTEQEDAQNGQRSTLPRPLQK